MKLKAIYEDVIFKEHSVWSITFGFKGKLKQRKLQWKLSV